MQSRVEILATTIKHRCYLGIFDKKDQCGGLAKYFFTISQRARQEILLNRKTPIMPTHIESAIVHHGFADNPTYIQALYHEIVYDNFLSKDEKNSLQIGIYEDNPQHYFLIQTLDNFPYILSDAPESIFSTISNKKSLYQPLSERVRAQTIIEKESVRQAFATQFNILLKKSTRQNEVYITFDPFDQSQCAISANIALPYLFKKLVETVTDPFLIANPQEVKRIQDNIIANCKFLIEGLMLDHPLENSVVPEHEGQRKHSSFQINTTLLELLPNQQVFIDFILALGHLEHGQVTAYKYLTKIYKHLNASDDLSAIEKLLKDRSKTVLSHLEQHPKIQHYLEMLHETAALHPLFATKNSAKTDVETRVLSKAAL